MGLALGFILAKQVCSKINVHIQKRSRVTFTTLPGLHLRFVMAVYKNLKSTLPDNDYIYNSSTNETKATH